MDLISRELEHGGRYMRPHFYTNVSDEGSESKQTLDIGDSPVTIKGFLLGFRLTRLSQGDICRR